MNLSKDAIRLLHWMCCHDQWLYIESLKSGYKRYNYRSFSALKDAKLVDATVLDQDYELPEYDEDGTEYFRESYRISDAGKAYLENLSAKKWPELREWTAIAISAVALAVSIIALLL